MTTLTERPEWVRDLIGYITREYPEVWGREIPRHFDVLSPLEPCERCGQPIVLARPHDQQYETGWAHLNYVYMMDGHPHVVFQRHSPESCTFIREQLP